MPDVQFWNEEDEDWESVRPYTPTPDDWQDLEDYREQEDFYERLRQEHKI